MSVYGHALHHLLFIMTFTNQMTIGLWVIVFSALIGSIINAEDRRQWLRGQLHTHTYWSDGRGFSEQLVEAYKQRGYDFVSMSDHNLFAEDPNFWREVVEEEGPWPPNVTQAMFDRYLRDFGKDWVETKTEGSVTSVRLKTYAEIKAKFEEPGKFILLPGVELTKTLDGRHLHMNYINLPVQLPSIKGANFIQKVEEPTTMSALAALNAAEAKEAAEERKEPYLLFLNHPFWIYYDVVPKSLIDCPEIRFLR